jgi:hypothetical protein
MLRWPPPELGLGLGLGLGLRLRLRLGLGLVLGLVLVLVLGATVVEVLLERCLVVLSRFAAVPVCRVVLARVAVGAVFALAVAGAVAVLSPLPQPASPAPASTTIEATESMWAAPKRPSRPSFSLECGRGRRPKGPCRSPRSPAACRQRGRGSEVMSGSVQCIV